MSDDNPLPVELLRRIHLALLETVAEEDPAMRGPLMRALDDGSVTVTVHQVAGRAYIYSRGMLDNGATISREDPGEVVGITVDADGDLAW